MSKPPKGPIRLAAEQLCREYPDAASRTLARRLAKEYGISIEQGRDYVRTIRGNKGKEHRDEATSPRPNGKAGTKPTMPPSKAEAWEPVVLPTGIQLAVLSDIHFPFHSEMALGAAVKYCKDRKPDILLINGDYGDWYSVSRFQKNPKDRNLKEEIACQRQGLAWLRSEFPKARIILKKGNHDERWDHYIWNYFAEVADDPLLDLETWLHADKHGIEIVGDQRPIMAGNLPIFHGHELPKGLTNPVNMARGAFLRMNDTVLVGHGHRSSQHSEPNWKHQEVATWSTGCLCELYPEYARINKWNHGFAFVEVLADGEFNIDNLRIGSNGRIRSS
jgi:predicted phosphodiesterase